MSGNNWLFIGMDKRLSTCSEIFSGRGLDSVHFATDHYTEQLGERIAELAPAHIVFPILQMKGTPIPVNLLAEETNLYTGVAKEEWLAPFKAAGHKIRPYLQEEQFIWQNARLTAEAFVHEYYARTARSIGEGHFHVAGFGKVGKMTAHLLKSIGATVVIIARSETQLGEAATLGYDVISLTDNFVLDEGTLVNTIPAKWLSVQSDSRLHIFDLASAPGCLKKSPAPEYYTVLLGLPGKHFPVDAAKALADALGRMYRK